MAHSCAQVQQIDTYMSNEAKNVIHNVYAEGQIPAGLAVIEVIKVNEKNNSKTYNVDSEGKTPDELARSLAKMKDFERVTASHPQLTTIIKVRVEQEVVTWFLKPKKLLPGLDKITAKIVSDNRDYHEVGKPRIIVEEI